ncbi:MAG: hypothetical protein HY279_04370, partial [Nitrospinae bacterium]|nr:hypothetical protein [Nitrospinota bacterium]
MIKRVIEFLIDNWNTYFPDTKKPEKVSLLQLCGDADYKRTEKIEVFLFLNGEKIPSLVLSLGRDHEYTEILQNEYTILKKLYSTCSQSLIDTIPRPILYEKIGMSYVLVITHLSGRTMEQMTIKKRWGRKRAALFLGVMTEWLIKLNHYTSTPLYPPLYQPPLSPPSKGGDKGEVKGGEEGGGNIYPYAKSLLNEYQIYYPSSNAYRDRILNLMKDISVKTTFVHGNPAAGNILVENPPHPPLIPPCPPLLKGGEGGLGELRMVDWAVAREKGLPLS